MVLSDRLRITLVICGAVCLLGLLTLSYLSGEKISVEEILGSIATHASALVIGVGWAGGAPQK